MHDLDMLAHGCRQASNEERSVEVVLEVQLIQSKPESPSLVSKLVADVLELIRLVICVVWRACVGWCTSVGWCNCVGCAIVEASEMVVAAATL
jgi:hypothetical protein